jgi:LuxR family maltose regulon positive regulatory protein
VRHAIAAPDVDLAAEVIGATYLQQLEEGRLAAVVGWLDALGTSAVESDRRLAVVRAWTMHFLGRHDEGNAALEAAVRAPSVGPMPDGAGSIEATVALVGAAFPGDDAAGMLAAARRAFALEANRRSPWTVTVHVLLGFGLVRMGQFAEARDHLRMGAELAFAGGMWMDAIGARALLARVALETGDSDLAEREARAALAIGETYGLTETATYAFALGVLGSILVRTGRLDDGAAMLEQARAGTELIAEPLALGELLVALGQARRMQGRLDESTQLFRRVDAIIERSRHPGYLRTLRRAAVPARESPAGESLTRRELEVLRALARGRSKRQTADELFVSYNTIHSQVRSIYRKLDVHSLTAAVARARHRGLID